MINECAEVGGMKIDKEAEIVGWNNPQYYLHTVNPTQPHVGSKQGLSNLNPTILKKYLW
jgi:hypothetical protein